jgi:hypothetical protein
MMEIYKIRKADALSSLLPNGSWGLNGDTPVYAETVAFKPTEAEIDAEVIRLQEEYDALQYQRDRAVSFPTWQEQMDLQYWDQVNGTTLWKDAIAKVKSDNPKE